MDARARITDSVLLVVLFALCHASPFLHIPFTPRAFWGSTIDSTCTLAVSVPSRLLNVLQLLSPPCVLTLASLQHPHMALHLAFNCLRHPPHKHVQQSFALQPTVCLAQPLCTTRQALATQLTWRRELWHANPSEVVVRISQLVLAIRTKIWVCLCKPLNPHQICMSFSSHPISGGGLAEGCHEILEVSVAQRCLEREMKKRNILPPWLVAMAHGTAPHRKKHELCLEGIDSVGKGAKEMHNTT